jgi:AcrR family transcriptional regulator
LVQEPAKGIGQEDAAKGMRRQSQNTSAEKACKIAKVAAKLFNSKGYLETNMDDIGNGARLSKGGIYHYFSSKDEILFFVLDNYLDVILQGLEETLQGISDPISRIKFIISRHIDLYTKNAAESKTLLHEAHCLPKKYYKTITAKERRYYQIVANVLAGLFGSKSRVTKAHITVLTFLLFGMCNWIYSWYDPKGTVTAEELSERIFAVFLDGVRKYSRSGSK